MFKKVKCAIIGPGNIGTDLLIKLRRSEFLEVAYVVGVKNSKGIEIAKGYNIPTSIEGLQPILNDEEIEIVFDCTGAGPHNIHAPLLKKAGKIAIDLTPAAIGPYTVPAVNLSDDILKLDNVNMVTCAGQATVPIVYAVNRVSHVIYAEIVSSISSKSAGPGTRQNLVEFIETTQKALRDVGGADSSKTIIVLNPAEPSILMRNTIYTKVENPDFPAIKASIEQMIENLHSYVPGIISSLSLFLKEIR